MAEPKSIINFARAVRSQANRVRGIFAMDREGVIGYDNDLIFHNPKDLAHFKKTTTGHIVIMGHKTFESMDEKPLPNRMNVVFTNRPHKRGAAYLQSHDGIMPENLKFIGSPMQLLEIQKDPKQKFYVIGGAGIFKAFFPAIDTWIITEYDVKLREPLPNPNRHIDPERLTPIRAFEHYSVGVEMGLLPEGYLEPKFRYFPDIARVRRSFVPSLMEVDQFDTPKGFSVRYKVVGYSRQGVAARNIDSGRDQAFANLYNSTVIQGPDELF